MEQWFRNHQISHPQISSSGDLLRTVSMSLRCRRHYKSSRHKSQGPMHKLALTSSGKCGRRLNRGLTLLETFVTLTLNFMSFSQDFLDCCFRWLVFLNCTLNEFLVIKIKIVNIIYENIVYLETTLGFLCVRCTLFKKRRHIVQDVSVNPHVASLNLILINLVLGFCIQVK
jgi:hypothetical protein